MSLLHYVKRFVSSKMRTSSIDIFVPIETKLTFQITSHKLYMEGYKVYFIIYNVMTLNSTSIEKDMPEQFEKNLYFSHHKLQQIH